MSMLQTIADWARRLRTQLAQAFARDDDAPTLQARVRARLGRYLRMFAGFALSVTVLGVAALYLAAAASRVPLETAPSISAPEGGAQGVAAAQYLFGLEARRDDLAADRLFAPASLKRREVAALRAAQRPAQAYVALLRVRRGARSALLSDARETADAGGRIAADALERLNAGAADQRIVFDRSPDGFRALAREAAAACAALAASLSDRAHVGALSREAEDAALFQARGEALGWLIVLRAAARDVEAPEGALDEVALSRALGALARAAAHDPVLFPSGPRGGAAAANHFAIVGLDLAVAAQEARALTER